jgi:predicted kinase
VSGPIPLVDAAALKPAARRALLVRAAAVGVLALLLAALALATGAVHGSRAAPRSSSLVVLDLSGSIGRPASATIVRALRAVAAQGGNAGLVLFSDASQEAVPPTAPARTLLEYVRVFSGAGLQHNPWSDSFSAGTQIGVGLAAARQSLARSGIERARVILVSDVGDAVTDLPLMRRELLAYARDPKLELHLAVVPGYDRSTVALFRRLLGRHALALGRPPATALRAESRGFPLPAVAVAVAIALFLAAYELTNAPLAWRETA